MYAIPSLALFILLTPIFGLTTLTAEIALVSYTLQILFRSIVAGIDGVPASVRESATAMGYTRRQQLWRVEIPLALPVIMSGLRIATVTTVGLVPIAGILGSDQGGLGRSSSTGWTGSSTRRCLVGARAHRRARSRARRAPGARRARAHPVDPARRARHDRAAPALRVVQRPGQLAGRATACRTACSSISGSGRGPWRIAAAIAVPAGLLLGRSRRPGTLTINIRQHRARDPVVRGDRGRRDLVRARQHYR